MPRAEAWGSEPRRYAVCTCGYTITANTLKTITARIDAHLAEASANQDHVFFIDEDAA